MIEWLRRIFGLITEERKARSEQARFLTTEYRLLNEEYRQKIIFTEKEYKLRIESLEQQIKELEAMRGEPVIQRQFEELIHREIEYHKTMIDSAGRERDLKEENIFLKLEINLLKQKKNGI